MVRRNSNSRSEEEPIRTKLDILLDGRPDAFKLKVQELVIRYKWDVNDPAFTILIATGQMEALLYEFPENFERMFSQALGQMQQLLGELRQSLTGHQGELRRWMQGLETAGDSLVSQVSDQVAEFRTVTQGQQQQLVSTVEQLLRQFRREREQLDAQAARQFTAAEHRHLASFEQTLRTLIQETGKAFRWQFTKEFVTVAAIVFVVVFSLGTWTGWLWRERDFQAFRYESDAGFGQQLVEWNKPQLDACFKANRTTCNLHIVQPKGKP